MKKFYDKYSWLIILTFAVGIVFLLFKGCPVRKPYVPVIIDTHRQDSTKSVIRYIEKVKTVEVVKWFKIKEKALSDTTPCGEEIRFVVQACDTVRLIDSTLIVALKNLVRVDSVIIGKCLDRIGKDSALIVKLNKKVKRNRRIAMFLGAVGIGAVGVNLSGHR